MTSQLASVEEIQKIMSENNTCPLVAWLMWKHHVNHKDAVKFPHKVKYSHNDEEKQFLKSIPYYRDYDDPAPGEAEALFPDSLNPYYAYCGLEEVDIWDKGLTSVAKIEKVMDEHHTNPLVAYFMLLEQISYEEAVKFYQQNRKHVDFFAHHDFETGMQQYFSPDGYLLRNQDLRDVDVQLLSKIRYYGKPFDQPTDEEAQALYPDSCDPSMRFQGFTEEQCRAVHKDD